MRNAYADAMRVISHSKQAFGTRTFNELRLFESPVRIRSNSAQATKDVYVIMVIHPP